MGGTTAEEVTHIHDSYRCPEHVDWCNCPNLDEWLCNPYWVSGHCPDGLLRMPIDVIHAAPKVLHGPFPCCGVIDCDAGKYDFMSSDPSSVTCPEKYTGN